jgi:hypothetical protein
MCRGAIKDAPWFAGRPEEKSLPLSSLFHFTAII